MALLEAAAEAVRELAGRADARRGRSRPRSRAAPRGLPAPRRERVTGRDALTASERRIAEIAAGGPTNREISERLFLTPKTVENHLGRIYVKLGISSRREIATALAAYSDA